MSFLSPAPAWARTLDDLVGQTILKNYEALHGCFRKALAVSRNKGGTLFLRATLGTEDSVSKVKVERDGLGYRPAVDCILTWVQGWTFEGASSLGLAAGSEVAFPLTFRAAPNQFHIRAEDLEYVRVEQAAEAKVLLQKENVGAIRASMALLSVHGKFELGSKPYVSQGIYVLSGQGWRYQGQRKIRLSAKTAIYLAAGCKMAISGKINLLQVFVPAGEETKYLAGKAPVGMKRCHPVVVNAQKRRPLLFKGKKLKVTPLFSSKDIKHAPFYMGLIEIAAGVKLPKHAHQTSAELVFLLDGEGETSCDGEKQVLAKDQAAYFADGKGHDLKVSERIVALQFFAPAGPEKKYFRP